MPYDPVTEDPILDLEHPPTHSLVTFTSHDHRLMGRVLTPRGSGPHPAVILMHGYPGMEPNYDLVHVLGRAGWAVLHFHYTGSWSSEGVFSLANVVADVPEACRFLVESAARFRVDPQRIVLIGHSLGGFAALLNAGRLPVIGLAALAPFNFGGMIKPLINAPDRLAALAAMWDEDTAPLCNVTGAAIVQEQIAHADEWDFPAQVPGLMKRAIYLLGARYDTISPTAVHLAPFMAALRAAGHHDFHYEDVAADHGFLWARTTMARRVVEWLRTLSG